MDSQGAEQADEGTEEERWDAQSHYFQQVSSFICPSYFILLLKNKVVGVKSELAYTLIILWLRDFQSLIQEPFKKNALDFPLKFNLLIYVFRDGTSQTILRNQKLYFLRHGSLKCWSIECPLVFKFGCCSL